MQLVDDKVNNYYEHEICFYFKASELKFINLKLVNIKNRFVSTNLDENWLLLLKWSPKKSNHNQKSVIIVWQKKRKATKKC